MHGFSFRFSLGDISRARARTRLFRMHFAKRNELAAHIKLLAKQRQDQTRRSIRSRRTSRERMCSSFAEKFLFAFSWFRDDRLAAAADLYTVLSIVNLLSGRERGSIPSFVPSEKKSRRRFVAFRANCKRHQFRRRVRLGSASVIDFRSRKRQRFFNAP